MEDFDGPHSLSMVISILNIVFLSPMLFGLILYEKFGSDKKRTLINQLVASIFWIMVAWNGTLHSTIVTRFIHGPFSGKIIVETFLSPSLGSFKPVNAPGNAAKVSSPPQNVYSFFLSAMTPNNFRLAHSHTKSLNVVPMNVWMRHIHPKIYTRS